MPYSPSPVTKRGPPPSESVVTTGQPTLIASVNTREADLLPSRGVYQRTRVRGELQWVIYPARRLGVGTETEPLNLLGYTRSFRALANDQQSGLLAPLQVSECVNKKRSARFSASRFETLMNTGGWPARSHG